MNNISESFNKNKKVILVILLVAISLIGIGIYIIYTQNNKVIFGRALDGIREDIEKHYFPNNVSEQYDSYTIESDINITAKSGYLESISLYSPQIAPYLKLVQNLSNTKSKVIVKQDNKNEKAFFSVDSTLNNTDLFSAKYLIENNTEYYFIKGFLNNYVNNGNNNYFETLSKNDSNIDNYNYLYELVISSLKDNLKSEYFTKKGEKEKIDNKDKTLQKVTLELNNSRFIEIYNSILEDLKKDKKASEILTSFDKDFKNYKIKSNEKILEDNQKLVFSVYVDNITYAIRKYKFDVIIDDAISTITYEKNKNGIVEFYANNRLQLKLEIEYKDNETNITVLKNGINKGNIVITKNNNLYAISINIKELTSNIKFLIKNETKDIKKNKSYKNTFTISGGIYSNNVSLVDINVSVDSKTSKGAKIEENVDNAVFAKDVTMESELVLQNQISNILRILMS